MSVMEKARERVLGPLRRAKGKLFRREPAAPAEEPEKSKHPPVVMIHGLNVPRHLLMPLSRRLTSKYGRETFLPGFNSYYRDLPNSTLHVARQIEQREYETWDAVTHSMGGVMLRWAVNHCGLAPPRRVVMIAPPNGGAWLADHLMERWGRVPPWIFGEAMLQLRRPPRGLTDHAGLLPGIDVGIIAGGSGTPRGERNWFGYPGDTDGTVGVAETILPGMKDFVLLNHSHTALAFSSQVTHMANLFLEHGVFRPKVRTPSSEEAEEDSAAEPEPTKEDPPPTCRRTNS